MSDQPQQPSAPDHAAPFRNTADLIDDNRGRAFGGAFVVVLPDGTVIDGFLIDSKANAAMILANMQTKIAMALQEIADAERGGQHGGFGRR